MRNPICLFKTIWRTLKYGKVVSGCNLETAEEPTPDNILLLRCKQTVRQNQYWLVLGLVEGV